MKLKLQAHTAEQLACLRYIQVHMDLKELAAVALAGPRQALVLDRGGDYRLVTCRDGGEITVTDANDNDEEDEYLC